MADFVNRAFLALSQISCGVEGVGFKEEAYLVAGFHEVVIARARLFVRCINRTNFCRVEVRDKFKRTRTQRFARFAAHEILDHKKTVAFVSSELWCVEIRHAGCCLVQEPKHFAA